jgi:PTS system mannitol-specific IIC component
MGSSVMGQAILKRKLREAKLDLPVDHAALSALPADAEGVIAHRSLAPRIRQLAPAARIYVVDQFIDTPVYEEIIREIRETARRR